MSLVCIRYTRNTDDLILDLSKYGHQLTPMFIEPTISKKIHFRCDECKYIITLIQDGFIENLWQVIINDREDKTADFYCEKYRALV